MKVNLPGFKSSKSATTKDSKSRQFTGKCEYFEPGGRCMKFGKNDLCGWWRHPEQCRDYEKEEK